MDGNAGFQCYGDRQHGLLRGSAERAGVRHGMASRGRLCAANHDRSSRRSLPDDSVAEMVDVAWRMPIDDYNTRTFTLKFLPSAMGKRGNEEQQARPKPPPRMRGTRRQWDMA